MTTSKEQFGLFDAEAVDAEPQRATPQAAVVADPPPAIPSPAEFIRPAADPSERIQGDMDLGPEPTNGGATSMDRTALVFLDDPVARKLAVAWTTCGGDERRWAATAGLADADSYRLRRMLRTNGICRGGGVTDTLALQYITAIVARPIVSQTKKKKKG